ncbi:MAG: radical SAM/SPASM domain-containing protein [Oscillospiraceae bacterium]
MTNGGLTAYMNRTIASIVSDALRHTLQNPRETAFLLRYRQSAAQAAQKRLAMEQAGQHVPAFLIASIANSCNLFCTGCYARAGGVCCETDGKTVLTGAEWDDIFTQAAALGIGIHLLAGGEPLLRRDVLQKAVRHTDTLFPIFTNGTLIDCEYLQLFDRHRNLLPVLSLEGNAEQTDGRRGAGVYQTITGRMHALADKKILFGASLTVTAQNLDELTNAAFYTHLQQCGCRLVFLVEYVPVDPFTQTLALSDSGRKQLEKRLAALRAQYPAMLFLAFPGDEKALGGCLAAGRGFFHINPYGAAEACPFAPYSDVNLREHSLLRRCSPTFSSGCGGAYFCQPAGGRLRIVCKRAQVEASCSPPRIRHARPKKWRK